MFLRMRLLGINLGIALALLLMLCLGAQNLNTRLELKLGRAKTAPLPSGFLIGVSIVLGVISGGSTATVILPSRRS